MKTNDVTHMKQNHYGKIKYIKSYNFPLLRLLKMAYINQID